MVMIRGIAESNFGLKVRAWVSRIRSRMDVFYQLRNLRARLKAVEENIAYEMESSGCWLPSILSLEETLRFVIENRYSLARYGDGEFELMAGRNMSFEAKNKEMSDKLLSILKNPLPNCLNCVPNIFGSLGRYRVEDQCYWRGAAVWMRPILRECVEVSDNRGVTQNAILGDPQVSRAYLGVRDKSIAPRIFELWKELFAVKDILIVEGRFSRLGVGNDLFNRAKSINRIWCPPKGAYAKYSEIKAAVLKYASKDTLIVMALGATATILAYDLSKLGYWAVDAGHVDIEYMWMKMGVSDKVPVPGKYVNECLNGRIVVKENNEEEALHVVEVIA